jgi:hypothetical protein
MRRAVDQLNVVVTCSSRKSRPPLPGFSIRDIKAHDFSSRLDQWVNRLKGCKEEKRIAALSLYQGDHWAIVRQLISDHAERTVPVRVWVASAGCGLISPDALIPSYGATFCSNDSDSVAQDANERRLWWAGLSQVSFEAGAPRTLSDLVKISPKSALLVAASPEYLSAISCDLEKAVESMARPERFVMLCREGARLGTLDEAKVHLSADLSSVVGGSLTSLNARMVRWLIDSLGASFNRSTAREAIEKLRSSCGPRTSTVRTKSSDEQISSFIKNLLIRDRRASGSAALASFRKAGMASEQRRFQALFQVVRQEVSIG